MDLEKARQGLRDYYTQTQSKNVMHPQELKDFMEPIFISAGFRQAAGEKPKILIVRDDAAGDFVLFSAFLREARRIYSGAVFVLLCSSRNKDLAGCCPYIDEVIVNDTLDNLDGTNASQAFEAAISISMKLMKYNFDLAFSPRLGVRSFSLLTAYMSGATQVIGFTQDRVNKDINKIIKLGWDCLMTQAIPMLEKPESDVARNLFILEYMTRMPIQNRRIEVWFMEEERRKAENLLMPLRKQGCDYLVAAVPAASLRMKQWPVERYVELFKWILSKNNKAGIVVMGGPDEMEVCRFLQESLGKRAISVAGEVSFRVSAALMSMLSIYVGNDTGLMHIASACSLPVLSVNCFPASLPLTSMSIPVRFTPYMVPSVTVLPDSGKDGCNNRYSYGCQHQHEPHCILNVTLDAMMAGYEELIQRVAAGVTKPMLLKS